MRSNRIFLLGALLLASCTTQKSTSDNSHRGLYDFESNVLHPEIAVYHATDTTTELHYTLDPSEILFSRDHIDSEFTARIGFEGEITQIISDSVHVIHEVRLTQIHPAQKGSKLSGLIEFPCEAGSISSLKLSIKDLNRNTSTKFFVELDKTNKLNSQNYLLTDEYGEALCMNQISGSNKIRVYCARCEDVDVQIARNDEEIKLPPPPFSDSRMQLPSHEDGLKMSLPMENHQLDINTTKGFYFISQDPENRLGTTLSVRDYFFPEIMTTDYMILTLRYITSRSEYESMNDGGRSREVMENFWIECAGSKEKARLLIQAYYSRVKEANMYFSHVIPGWKTDRGLIHIVFGNPKKIFRYAEKEVWLYGEEDNMNSLQFTFRKKPSPYSNNHMVLQRDHVYKNNWERAVTSWRNGRIYEN